MDGSFSAPRFDEHTSMVSFIQIEPFSNTDEASSRNAHKVVFYTSMYQQSRILSRHSISFLWIRIHSLVFRNENSETSHDFTLFPKCLGLFIIFPNALGQPSNYERDNVIMYDVIEKGDKLTL